jgi:hypothetical protein
MVIYRQELAGGTELQINKVRQFVNEMYVNFLHLVFKVKEMLIRKHLIFYIIGSNVTHEHLYPLGSYAVCAGKYLTSNLTFAK